MTATATHAADSLWIFYPLSSGEPDPPPLDHVSFDSHPLNVNGWAGDSPKLNLPHTYQTITPKCR